MFPFMSEPGPCVSPSPMPGMVRDSTQALSPNQELSSPITRIQEIFTDRASDIGLGSSVAIRLEMASFAASASGVVPHAYGVFCYYNATQVPALRRG